ncbi:hypothetical protein C0Q70_16556 [Pomacea canaliculata]|uniref:Uncharacterized protein n=1 Tax=Pomacea canaliculata TaxID=400727 RepID=A0A2T7NQ39_POMCA|nr:hypothetical protein C0Q70_16556 [Pomacea canaliculata]
MYDHIANFVASFSSFVKIFAGNFRREFRVACYICCRRGSERGMTMYEASFTLSLNMEVKDDGQSVFRMMATHSESFLIARFLSPTALRLRNISRLQQAARALQQNETSGLTRTESTMLATPVLNGRRAVGEGGEAPRGERNRHLFITLPTPQFVITRETSRQTAAATVDPRLIRFPLLSCPPPRQLPVCMTSVVDEQEYMKVKGPVNSSKEFHWLITKAGLQHLQEPAAAPPKSVSPDSTRRTRLSTAPNVNVQMEVLQVVMDSRMKAIMAML